MDLDTYLNKYYTLRNIKRFHMESVLSQQNLADHGHGVASLFYIICKELNIKINSEDLFLVMQHDFAETYTGDINKAVKEINEATSSAWNIIEEEAVPTNTIKFLDEKIKEQLNEGQNFAFQLADEFDAMLYCFGEYRKGNKFIIDPLRKYLSKVMQRIESHLFKASRDSLFLKIFHIALQVEFTLNKEEKIDEKF